jgi:hypothetical protein
LAALWLFVLPATSLSAGASRVEQQKRPNIVFLLLDDVRYDDLVDHPFVRLPNIERLAEEGATFTRFFTSAPLCSPSRAVFLTGQYPFRNGIIDNGERAEQSHRIVTFPRLLRDTGYRTGFFGKWHMGHEDDTARPGFDRWVSFVGQGSYFDPTLNIDGRTVKSSGYVTDILTDQAIAFIESSPKDQPFLAFVAHKASHPEVHPNRVRTFPSPARDAELYAEEALPRAPNWRAPLTGKPALERPHEHGDPRSPAGGLPDDIVKGRLRMLSAVDRGVGRFVISQCARRGAQFDLGASGPGYSRGTLLRPGDCQRIVAAARAAHDLPGVLVAVAVIPHQGGQEVVATRRGGESRPRAGGQRDRRAAVSDGRCQHGVSVIAE